MGMQTPTTISFDLPDGRDITIETGKLATQADGSVVLRRGNMMIFASVVSAKKPRDGQNFFPLSVDYQEKFSATGRIPGNFFRREARLNDYEILVSRLVDRVCRPLFPNGYMNDTQIILNLISSDKIESPDAYAALAASAALTLSDIPFAGPISEVRVARIDGELKINPLRSEIEEADINIIVGATEKDVMMVEGECDEVQESELVAAIKAGHDAIKVQCQAQNQLAEKFGVKVKREFISPEHDAEVEAIVKSFAAKLIEDVARRPTAKFERKDAFDAVKSQVKEHILETKGEEYAAEKSSDISASFDKVKKSIVREVLLSDKLRLDGRGPKDIRDIWTEVAYMPSTHGSAIFNRGETQALASLTLGTKLDEQMVDVAMELTFEKFILHYNFPAYSVGETRPMRGPGRREVGHANLAGRSLKKVMPDDYPYTVRIISDILESNGSSSMATVCAGTLALMDGGVPIKAPVSGIAMGMISDGDRSVILSDILGDEDGFGDMDFKVTGTHKGITACQMDIKIDGLPYEQLEEALLQAKEGRIHILNEMGKTLAAPNADMKPHAPRLVSFDIPSSFIGAVIGPGGRVIQEMQRTTGATITIDEVDGVGRVAVSGTDGESVEAAVKQIKAIAYEPEVGEEFEAEVRTIQPFGVFVAFMPGKEGLVHISELSWSRIEKIEDAGINVGDKMNVKIIGIDERTGKVRLSRRALTEKPEGYVEPERRPRRPRPDGDRRRGGNDRRRRDGDRRPPRRD